MKNEIKRAAGADGQRYLQGTAIERQNGDTQDAIECHQTREGNARVTCAWYHHCRAVIVSTKLFFISATAKERIDNFSPHHRFFR